MRTWKEFSPISGPAIEILRHSASHYHGQGREIDLPGGLGRHRSCNRKRVSITISMWPRPFTNEDLEKIGTENAGDNSQKLPVHTAGSPREEAIRFFSELGEKYKVELLEELTDPVVYLLSAGRFYGSLPRPHIPNTGYLKAFKLTSGLRSLLARR